MAVTPDAAGETATVRRSWTDTLAVYLKRRVLIVMFLGFSSGLPLALSGSTLLVWVREAGAHLGTLLVAAGAFRAATASATQDIVVDAFRVETLDESEQAAGMASYVAAYRIGMLASTAGALFLVSGFESFGLDHHAAWRAGYAVMAALVLIGVATTLFAAEPEKSPQADAVHARESSLRRVIEAAVGAFSVVLSRAL